MEPITQRRKTRRENASRNEIQLVRPKMLLHAAAHLVHFAALFDEFSSENLGARVPLPVVRF